MRALEPRLFPYIWRYSKVAQLRICAVVLASLPFYFASLDLPKRIVNDAITGKAYAHGEATASGAFANKCFGVPCRCRRYMYILAVKYVIPI